MIKKSIVAVFISLAAMFFATENSFAQGGPCLLGVGNCPQGNNNQNVDPGGGIRYLEGEDARRFLAANNYGSRYLLVLQTYWDHSENCPAEERAWVSSLVANGNGKVAVKIGSSRKILIRNKAVPTAERINAAEAWIHNWRNQIYELLKYKERIAPYLSNAYYQKWAQQELQKADGWIKHYENSIKNAQTQIAQAAP
ncbi:MAG TPA: hypothetical protein VGB02_03140 [Pyrinomonadaceae bacterium]|jgi:hypothetical protein